MRKMHYLLQGRTPVPVSMAEWASALEDSHRHIAETLIGKTRVSTVFLGLDHQFGRGAPLLFETMVFDGPFELTGRYATYSEAERGHDEAVYLVAGMGRKIL